MRSSWGGLLVSLALVLLVQVIGGLVTATSVNSWYLTLAKPSFNPPGWIFGPVWTFLYVSMAVAAWLVWRRSGFRFKDPKWQFYLIQLLLNLLWTILFFGFRKPGWAFVEILILNIFILFTLCRFWKVDIRAGVLLVPYWLWVSFAGILNFSIWHLSRNLV